MKQPESGKRWKSFSRAMLVVSLLLVRCAAHETNDPLHITANFDGLRSVAPNTQLQLHASRPLVESDGRLAIVLGNLDITALCAISSNDIVYVPSPLPLPVGETSVVAYLVSPDNDWIEIARLRLLVEEPKQLAAAESNAANTASVPSTSAAQEKQSPFQLIPSISLNVKSQSTVLFFPDASKPARINFTDVGVQATFQGNYKQREVSIQNQFDFAGSSVQSEALRFGQLGNRAPQIDLSAYTMQYELHKVKIRLGNVSFGTNRELINSFTSRGISVTVPITKRFDISGALMNGTSIVGFDNFFGVSRAKHQIASGTLGIELFEKRPGGFRVELSGLNGSLLPLNGFNQSNVNDAEQSRGVSIRLVGSDKTQRFRFDGGFATSRFTNPADPLLYQGRNVVPVKRVWRNARYADLSYDFLRGYQLTKTRPLSLSLTYRHERVDPLYRSIPTFTQADHLNNQFDLTGSLGTINFAANYSRGNDNLNGIRSILETLSRRSAFNLSAPALALIGGKDQGSKWIPRLSYTFDRIHQAAAFVPVNGDFVSATQIPDQVSLSQTFAADWQLSSRVRAGYRFNYSFQDNRQTGRQRADLLNEVHGVSVGLNLLKSLDLNFDVGAERSSSFEQNTTNSTLRVATNLTWRMTPRMVWSLNGSTTGAGDHAGLNHRRDADLDLQYSWQFLTTEKSRWKKMQGQFFIRYSNRYGFSRDFLFGFQNLTKLQTFNAGLNLTFF